MNKVLPQGLWGVLATPFDEDLAVDRASLRNEGEETTHVPLLDRHLAALPALDHARH